MQNEDDVSAEEKAAFQGSWFSEKNEYRKRKKGFGRKKIKGQKEVISLGHISCGLFFF